MYRPTKSRVMRRTGVSLAVALGVAGASIGAASAASTNAASPSTSTSQAHTSGPTHPEWSGGKVSAISATSMTVSHLDGSSASYVLTTSTLVTKGGQPTTSSVVAIGDLVCLSLASPASNRVTQIDIVTPRVWGRIASVGVNSLTMSTPRGPLEVSVSSSTVIRNGDSSVPVDSSTLSVGMIVSVAGTPSADGGTIDASLIEVGVPPRPPDARRPNGHSGSPFSNGFGSGPGGGAGHRGPIQGRR